MRYMRLAANTKRWRSGRSGTSTETLAGASSLRCRRGAPLLAFLLLASEGMSVRSTGAADLIVDSGTTTISDAQSYDTTNVATNAGDVATLTVTTSGTLTSALNLYAGVAGTGTLNVAGGTVNNAKGYLGYDAGSDGTATVSSGTWANSGSLYLGLNGTGTLNVTGGSVTNTNGVFGD